MMIRATEDRDHPDLAKLETLSFSNPWSQSALVGALKHSVSLSLVAEDPAAEPPIVGYLLIRLAGPESELLRIAVHPDRRQEGLGRSLLQAAITELESQPVERCFLEVRADNAAAIALYRRFQAQEISRRTSYYRDGAEALVFSLEIGPEARPGLS